MKFLKKKEMVYNHQFLNQEGMNGLTKIHKALEDGIQSFCPILSTIGTPTYNVATILRPTTETPYQAMIIQ